MSQKGLGARNTAKVITEEVGWMFIVFESQLVTREEENPIKKVQFL
jgi:hypothetical protein